jgi:hypothetical protein
VGIELIQEVHEEVNLERADAQDHVLLRLGPMSAVVASRLLPLHPEVDKLLELQGERGECRWPSQKQLWPWGGGDMREENVPCGNGRH